jgi:4-amino-4-deoxy-L-arabinose transferase-like glycosyltransferase
MENMLPAARWPLAVIWSCFLLRAIFYCSVIPLWEGYDEYSHFAFIQYFANTGKLPNGRQTNSSREVQESLRLTPMPWMQRDVGQNVTHDAWWNLASALREDRERQLRTLPPEWGAETPPDFLPIYEAQQPPLYYCLLAVPYRLLSQLPLVTRVWWLRLFGAALASLVIPLGFLTAREILNNVRAALAVTALIASMPELMLIVCRIGNDALAVAAGTVCLFLAFRTRESQRRTRHVALLGAATGLALLTKAYFLALLPPLALLPTLVWRPRSGKRIAIHILLLAAGPVVIAGWWYARNLLLTGAISGEQTELAMRRFSALELLRLIPRVPWIKAADFIFMSHIWLGDWSFLVLRGWMYHVFALVWCLAAFGFVVRYFHRPPIQPSRTDLSLLAGFYLSFLLAMAYHAVLTFGHSGIAGTMGYYLYAMVAAEVVLVFLGLGAILPGRWIPRAPAVLTLSFAALEAFGLLFYMIPYYTGLIEHLQNGHIPALHLDQLVGGGAHTILEGLAINKPAFLTVPVLVTIGLLFVLATMTLVAMSFTIALGRHQGKQPAR